MNSCNLIVFGLGRDRIESRRIGGMLGYRLSVRAGVRFGGHRFILVGDAIHRAVLHVSLTSHDRGPLDS